MKPIVRKEGSGLFSFRPSWFQDFFDDEDFLGMTRFAGDSMPAVNVLEDAKAQISVLQKVDAKQAAIEIARGLMNNKGWKKVAEILRNCDEDPESIRWMVLSYFSKVALGGNGKAVAIMEEFQDNYFDTKKAGLIMSCFRACNV
jgi:hypothetical protein